MHMKHGQQAMQTWLCCSRYKTRSRDKPAHKSPGSCLMVGGLQSSTRQISLEVIWRKRWLIRLHFPRRRGTAFARLSRRGQILRWPLLSPSEPAICDQDSTITRTQRSGFICDWTPTVIMTRILSRSEQDPIASPSSGPGDDPASCSGSNRRF